MLAVLETRVYLDSKQQCGPRGSYRFQSHGKLGQIRPWVPHGGRAEQSEMCWQCQQDRRLKKEARKASYFKANSSCTRITEGTC